MKLNDTDYEVPLINCVVKSMKINEDKIIDGKMVTEVRDLSRSWNHLGEGNKDLSKVIYVFENLSDERLLTEGNSLGVHNEIGNSSGADNTGSNGRAHTVNSDDRREYSPGGDVNSSTDNTGSNGRVHTVNGDDRREYSPGGELFSCFDLIVVMSFFLVLIIHLSSILLLFLLGFYFNNGIPVADNENVADNTGSNGRARIVNNDDEGTYSPEGGGGFSNMNTLMTEAEEKRLRI
ncbi:hypothetical protein OROMI_027118 [Orobanche minor]